MTNVLQDGATTLIGWLKTSASRTVRYERAGETIIAELLGTCAAHSYEVVDEGGLLTTITAYEWTFHDEDFVDGGGALLAARPGDRIVTEQGGADEYYELLPMAGKPIQERDDSSGIIQRLRTKLVKVNRGE